MFFSCINGTFILSFEFQKDKELYFDSSRVGSADPGSLLCRLVSGNMNPKTYKRSFYKAHFRNPVVFTIIHLYTMYDIHIYTEKNHDSPMHNSYVFMFFLVKKFNDYRFRAFLTLI